MTAFLTLAAIVIVGLVVWFVIFIPVADMRAPKFKGKIEPEQPWPAPPAPPGPYLTVDCDEYVFKGGRCYQYEYDTICPREPQCHNEDHRKGA